MLLAPVHRTFLDVFKATIKKNPPSRAVHSAFDFLFLLRIFYFNVPCQLTTLLNLRLFIFGSTSFRWLRSIRKTLISDGNIFYFCQISYTPSISGRQIGRKTRDECAGNVNSNVCVGLILSAQQPENDRPR